MRLVKQNPLSKRACYRAISLQTDDQTAKSALKKACYRVISLQTDDQTAKSALKNPLPYSFLAKIKLKRGLSLKSHKKT